MRTTTFKRRRGGGGGTNFSVPSWAEDLESEEISIAGVGGVGIKVLSREVLGSMDG